MRMKKKARKTKQGHLKRKVKRREIRHKQQQAREERKIKEAGGGLWVEGGGAGVALTEK